MKFVSWNVNGIRAAWTHGLSEFLDTCDADIYAFQETKVDVPYKPVEAEGYYAYWSFCERRKGYSGTLCLTKFEPIAVSHDFYSLMNPLPSLSEEASTQKTKRILEIGGDRAFDCEGRIITLEYPEFYFVNCYVPNPQGGPDRYDYRNEWDRLLTDYMGKLIALKPVILCGDFNVAINDKDIYEGSKWVEIYSEGYQATEREHFLNIIGLGFTDSFRLLHPETEQVFSWWSNRRNKRDENKGWRLDYFLVAKSLMGSITEADIMTDVFGSDHCLVTVSLDMAISGTTQSTSVSYRHKAKKYEIPADLDPFQRSLYVGRFTNAELGAVWDSLNWDVVENNVANMQEALAKSAYGRSDSLIKKWQQKIAFSIDAKVLAVRHVCSNEGGVGPDRVRWVSSKDKMAAAIALSSKNFHAVPARLLLINSKNGKTRRIHVETWHDRAMQALYAMTLDPVAESWGDRKSFAFRRGRSHFDAHGYLLQAFEGADAPTWGFQGDVRQCYEHISHEWIEENIPLAPTVLHEFLTAGYFFAGDLYAAEEGVGIGLSLSPIIANMTLDGLQDAIYRGLQPRAFNELIPEDERPEIDYANGNMVRYADDFIVTTRTEAEAEKVQEIVREFLIPRGLELSEKKSGVINIAIGFDFMSRHYCKKNGCIYCEPSTLATERFMERLRDTVENHTGSQQSLIAKLNRKIDGWATYHKVEDAMETFRRVDIYLQAILLDSCERKHPKWDRTKVIEKYWYKDRDGHFIYALPNKREHRLKSLSNTVLIHIKPVKTNVNPYIEREYLDWRTHTREIYNVTGIYRDIWERQNGRCFYCGCRILPDQERMLIQADNSARKKVQRYAYIHTRCADCSVNYIDTDTLPETITDVMALLDHLNTDKRQRGQKFLPLGEFFRNSTKISITMNFSEIEDILGYPLGKSSENPQWWTRTGFMNISQCWLDNGYEIKKLSVEKKRVTFHQKWKNMTSIEIPEVFLTGRIPGDCKYEAENYFSYLVKKYGL